MPADVVQEAPTPPPASVMGLFGEVRSPKKTIDTSKKSTAIKERLFMGLLYHIGVYILVEKN